MRHLGQGKFQTLALSMLMLLFTNAAMAQYLMETGSPTWTTPESVPMGFVNLANGNLHIEIPLATVPQRGGRSFVVKMVYDSRIWKIVDNGSSESWQPDNVPQRMGYDEDSLGWRFVTTTDNATPTFPYDKTTYSCTSGGNTYYWHKYQNYRFYDVNGTVRRFPVYYETGNVCHTAGPTTLAGLALDATGYLMTLNSNAVDYVIAPDGVLETAPGSADWVDANGNFIDGSTSTPIDTLNRTVLQRTEPDDHEVNYTILTSQGSSVFKVFTQCCLGISTNFNVSGVTEYSGNNRRRISHIELPDGSAYLFTYETGSGTAYGLLKSMTLPTGEVVNFTHTNVTDTQGNKQRWVNTVTVGGGTTTFTRSSCGTNCNKITVARPSADETVYNFTVNTAGAWNTQTKSYTGSAASGTLMLTADRTYDTSLSNPVTSGIAFVRPASTTTTIPGASGNLVSKTEATFDTFVWVYQGAYYTASRGNLLTSKQYAFGSGTVGSLMRQQVLTYLHDSDSNYLGMNIVNRVTNAQTQDAGGNKITEAITTYDSGSLTSVSGVTHHLTTYYGTGFALRGNPTETKVWTGSGSSTVCSNLNYLCSSAAYDITGQVRSSTDTKGNTTQFTYTDAYHLDSGYSNPPPAYSPAPPTTNALVTGITYPNGNTVSMGYYYGSSKTARATDPNTGATRYFHYQDPLDRLTKGHRPGGGWSQRTYTSATQVDLTSSIDGSTNATGQISINPATRTKTSSLTSDPSGTTSTNSTYDASGRPLTFSNPFRTGDPVYTKSVVYDGLNRVTRTILQGGNYTEAFYGATVGGAGGLTAQLCQSSDYDLGFPGLGYPVLNKDVAGKKRQGWSDALGRLIEVDEPDATGALTLKTCYQYDLLNNLKKVTQGVQTRTMSYDALSRLTSETTPEGGTINLYYTTGGVLCSGSASAPCRRIDARGITTTYTYDIEDRLTGKSYSNGDPSVTYSYDQTSCNGLTITNGKGRRTCMTDGSGTTAWSYNVDGQVLAEKRTIGTVTKTTSYTYNANGSVNQITYPSGLIIKHYYNTAGRLTRIDCAGYPICPAYSALAFADGAVYEASGALKEVLLGKWSGVFWGYKRTFTYNSRLQPSTMKVKHTNDTVTLLDYTYNFTSGSVNDGHVKSVTNNLNNNRTQTYTYDEMNRLKTAKSTATSGSDCWGLDYTYDRYANLSAAAISADRGGTGCSAPTLSLSINTSNNKITNSGFQYDAAGNLTNDGFSSYTWNAEGRMASYNSGSVSYTYDGDGKRVKKAAGSPSQYDKLYWYGPGGQVLSESALDGTPISEFIYFGGTRIARMDMSAGNIYYFMGDRLGNARIVANWGGTVVEESDYYPFGGERPITDTMDNQYKFTQHERDAESGLDHTLQRQYSCNQGRWLAPDRHRGNRTDPQSFNRYAYAWNNPGNLVDADGAYPCPPGMVENPDYLEQGGPLCLSVQDPLPPMPPLPDDDLGIPDTAEQRGEAMFLQLLPKCRQGLIDAHGDDSNYQRWLSVVVNNVLTNSFKAAASQHGIDWRLLAAIGIRESNAGRDMVEDGKGGRGYYQIDIGANPGISEDQAMNFDWSTDWAARELAGRLEVLRDSFARRNLEMYTGDDLLKAMGAMWNMYPHDENYTGDPALIDVGTNSGNYGSNILNLMQCFKP